MRNSQLAGTSQIALTSEFMPDNCRIAIEQSAYMLYKLFPKCAVLRANLPGSPFPVVMALLKDKELKAYSREHIVQRPTPSHYVLLSKPINTSSFARWHRQQLNA